MPAAAVIPAPIAYIKVVAVEKLVVGSRREGRGEAGGEYRSSPPPLPLPTSGRRPRDSLRWETLDSRPGSFTSSKSECSKQARSPLNATAWDDGTGWNSRPSAPRKAMMIDRDGRGCPYSAVRGEILGPAEDEQPRKRPPGTSPLIKNESRGIEDDQIPS